MIGRRWSVIINPKAGRGALSLDDVVSATAERGIDVSITTTLSVDQMTAQVTEQIGAGYRRFVAVGGDGTAHYLVNAIMATGLTVAERFTLAIVATGSGSDFVRTFGHRPGLASGFDRITDPDLYTIDLGMLDGDFGSRYFLNAANTGVVAAAARRAGRLSKRMGARRYTAAFWMELPGFPVRSISMTCDRHTFDGDAISVVIANGQYFGGGLNVAPRATLVDGLFDVQIFQAPKRQAISVMPRVIRGSHLTHRAVRRYIGASVTVSNTQDWPVEADGEHLGYGPVSITAKPAAIDFVA